MIQWNFDSRLRFPMNYFGDKFWCLSRSCVTGVSQRPVSGRAETHNLARTKGCHGETGEKEDGTMVHPGTGQPRQCRVATARSACSVRACAARSALGLVPSDFFLPWCQAGLVRTGFIGNMKNKISILLLSPLKWANLQRKLFKVKEN